VAELAGSPGSLSSAAEGVGLDVLEDEDEETEFDNKDAELSADCTELDDAGADAGEDEPFCCGTG